MDQHLLPSRSDQYYLDRSLTSSKKLTNISSVMKYRSKFGKILKKHMLNQLYDCRHTFVASIFLPWSAVTALHKEAAMYKSSDGLVGESAACSRFSYSLMVC